MPPCSLSCSSSWSSAQRSCCGPAAQAATESLGDSRSCHFLCVAPGPSLEAECAPAVRGRGCCGHSPASPFREGDRAVRLSCVRGAPHTQCKPAKSFTERQRVWRAARCVQLRLGANQSGRRGGGMCSPSGIPPGALNEHIFVKINHGREGLHGLGSICAGLAWGLGLLALGPAKAPAGLWPEAAG